MPDTQPATPKRFRIAFSFAGEKRAFVHQAARLLADRFGEDKILYDKFHESEFSRDDLAFYLPALYHNESELIVGVFCTDYEQKEWCGLEYRALYDLIKKGHSNQVMLTRFNYVDVKGLFSLAGYTELDDKTPEELVTLILERLALNEGLPKNHYKDAYIASGKTPRTSIPHNLPALQPFFGRTNELQKIAEALDPESRTWGALIDGPGGMGKTSLAVRAAYDAPATAFERIVFVSLKSRELDDDGVRDLSGFLISGLAELLNELARELGRDDITKTIETERPRLLLDALRNTKTLLVLDNLESLTKTERDTVFTFVKRLPPGCKAILTSRGRIGSGAEELILEQLDEKAALQTLAELATHNTALANTTETERRTLYNETSGKPLLLRWTAGQIGRGSCLGINDAIQFLRSCPKGNDPLEFIFGDLVEDFSEAETKTLCALTYFTLPAKTAHIAAIAEQKEAATLQALKLLTNRSLVVPSSELQTFTLVPLVADFLRVKKPQLVRETGSRLQKQVYAMVVENGYENHDRFPVLEANWPSIAAALPGFLSGENEPLQEVCDALEDFLNFTGRWDERLALMQDAERVAVTAGDIDKAGWRAYNAGWVYQLRGQSADVLACANQAEAYWEKAGAGAREQAIAISLRGTGYQLAKNYPEAISAFRKALELDKTRGLETQDIATDLNDLAVVEWLSGDLDAAERDCKEALRIAKTINSQEGIAIYTGNLADLALDREDWIGAETGAREALGFSEQLGRQQLIASNCYYIAKALLRQGNKEDALPFSRRAVEIRKKLRVPNLAEAEELLAECEGGKGK